MLKIVLTVCIVCAPAVVYGNSAYKISERAIPGATDYVARSWINWDTIPHDYLQLTLERKVSGASNTLLFGWPCATYVDVFASPAASQAIIVMSTAVERRTMWNAAWVSLSVPSASRMLDLPIEGVESIASSWSPRPSILWTDEGSILFTSRKDMGGLPLKDDRIVLMSWKLGAAVPQLFNDEVTGVTALIEPAIGHAFVRGETDEIYFKVGHRCIYRLDAKKHTVGPKTPLPKDFVFPKAGVLTREMLERIGAVTR